MKGGRRENEPSANFDRKCGRDFRQFGEIARKGIVLKGSKSYWQCGNRGGRKSTNP